MAGGSSAADASKRDGTDPSVIDRADVAAAFETDASSGLTAADAALRLARMTQASSSVVRPT